MKVLVTGAGGFVGRWLTKELDEAGHEVIAAGHSDLDVTEVVAVDAVMRRHSPDAIAHLAGVSFAPAAAADPEGTLRLAVNGTLSVIEAMRRQARTPALLITGSGEVYRTPSPGDGQLTESSPLGPRTTYGRAKLAQEAIALAAATADDLPVVATRSFNHTGPGQGRMFVLPALADRLRASRDQARPSILAGNLDVRRDFSDVRDVVVAYRRLLEGLVDGSISGGGAVVNVASGRSFLLRDLLDELCRIAGVQPSVEIDPSLVRADDPPEIAVSAELLRTLTGWQPRIPIERTLADLWADVSGGGPG